MPFEQLDDVWPFRRDPAHPLLPPSRFTEIRQLDGIAEITMYDGTRVALATRFDDVRSVLMNPATSSDGRLPGFPYLSDATRANRGARPTIDRLDPPEHDEQRAMLAGTFTQKRIREMRPFLEQTVDELIDRLLEHGGQADFLTEIAEPLPSIVICRLLDLPLSDAPFLLDRVHVWTNDQGDPAEITEAAKDVTDYFERVIDERMTGDGTDLVSRLVRDQLIPGRITRRQLLLTMHLLMTAGFDTTTNTLALGTLLLFRNRAAWDELAADTGGELVNGAVEEMLRYLSVAHSTHLRLAREPIPVGHQVIPAGMGIAAPQAAANHDPARFVDPDRFDMRRDSRDHLAFGAGVHQCLGQALARAELQIVFAKLPRRVPTLQLDVSFEEVLFRPNAMVYGVESLPVRW